MRIGEGHELLHEDTMSMSGPTACEHFVLLRIGGDRAKGGLPLEQQQFVHGVECGSWMRNHNCTHDDSAAIQMSQLFVDSQRVSDIGGRYST